MQRLIDELKDKTHLCGAVQSVVNSIYQNNNTVAIFEKVFNELVNDADHEAGDMDIKTINEATVLLQDIDLLDKRSNPKKLHWLHTKLLDL